MENYNDLLQPLSAGLATYMVFWTWKKQASKWSTWFPLLKKSAEWTLIGLAIVVGVYSVSTVLSGTVPPQNAALAYLLGLGAPWLLLRKRFKNKEVVKRGSSLASSKEVAALVKATKKPADISFGGVPIPRDAEPYHMLMAGSTGTGKSVSISGLIETIRERGDTVILVDSGGGFLSKYYDPETDFVFNPYDARCVGWSPTAEMQGAWDAQALARSIVPDGVGDNKEWNSYAQTLISSILRRLWETKRLTLKDFLYYVQAASLKELGKLLEGTAASSQLASEKTFGSIRTIANNYVAAYDYLPMNKETFSIADMITAEHSGILYVTYRDDQLDSLRNIIACLLDVASRTILSLEPDPDRRVWLIIDEFASIGKVQSIEQVATKARKNGGCLVLGIQSISQLKDRYGEHGAQTILSCLSTWLVLRVSDADTAEYMSKYIGDAEVQRTQQGASASDSGDTQSWNEQNSTQRVLLPSQMQAFKNLHGVLKLAGNFPVCEIDLEFPRTSASSASSFTPRDFTKDPLLRLTEDKDNAEPAAQAPSSSRTPAASPTQGTSEPSGTAPSPSSTGDQRQAQALAERAQLRQVRDHLTSKLEERVQQIAELESLVHEQKKQAAAALEPQWVDLSLLSEDEVQRDQEQAEAGAIDFAALEARAKRKKNKPAEDDSTQLELSARDQSGAVQAKPLKKEEPAPASRKADSRPRNKKRRQGPSLSDLSR